MLSVELGRQSPFETGQQSLLDVLQLDGRLVRREDQLLARQLQVVEDVEERVLRTGLSRQLLDVVDDQHVDHLVEVDEVGNLAVLVGRLELRLELVHRDVQHLQLRVALAHLVADRLHDVGLSQPRIPIYIKRIEGVVSRVHRYGHARRAGQPVALALDEGREREVRIQLRIDDKLLDTRNYKRIFYICGVGLRIETRDGCRVGVGRYGNRRSRRTGHGVVQSRLLPVELRDDRFEERDVVLLDLADVAFVGNPQAKRRAVEFERDDGLKPLFELLGGGPGLDLVQAVLPYIAICPCVV